MTKIMLVEDDKSLREIYGIRLIAEGYEIKSANDGEQALAMAIKEKPDLIISDVMMPKISGFDMLDILRATPETKDIKVIMMTALSSEDQRTRGESLGANKYLVKSQVGIEDVVRTVHEVLADAPVAAPAAPSFGPLAPSAAQQAQPVSAPANPLPEPQPVITAPATPEPLMPEPTAPFSSPAPASLGDTVSHQPQAPEVPVNPAVSPDPGAPVYNPNPTPEVNAQAQPTPAPVVNIPVQSVPTPQATPIQDITPAPAAPVAAPTPTNIADLIAQELGNQPQPPAAPQA